MNPSVRHYSGRLQHSWPPRCERAAARRREKEAAAKKKEEEAAARAGNAARVSGRSGVL